MSYIKMPLLSNMFSVVFEPLSIELSQQLTSISIDMINKKLIMKIELPIECEAFLVQLQDKLRGNFNVIITSNERTPVFGIDTIRVVQSNMELNYANNQPVYVLLECSYEDIRRPSGIQY